MRIRFLLPFVAVLLLARNGLGQDVAAEPSPAKLPIEFVVRLPADAELELMGTPMQGSGEVRRFKTVPVEVDKNFKYAIRATWNVDGKPHVVERTLAVSAGQVVEVELRELVLSSEEKAVLELVNKVRSEKGIDRLEFNSKLVWAARRHAENMAKQSDLEHALDGKDFWQRIEAEGYAPRAAAENIGQGARTPEKAVELWTDSPGHSDNMFNPEYRELGVGIATAKSGERYWVQVFASPAQTNGR